MNPNIIFGQFTLLIWPKRQKCDDFNHFTLLIWPKAQKNWVIWQFQVADMTITRRSTRNIFNEPLLILHLVTERLRRWSWKIRCSVQSPKKPWDLRVSKSNIGFIRLPKKILAFSWKFMRVSSVFQLSSVLVFQVFIFLIFLDLYYAILLD